jgi:hypothetical protein
MLQRDFTAASVMPGMDCRHPGSQEASGDIRVNLGSSIPCWNDGFEGVCLDYPRLSSLVFPKEFRTIQLDSKDRQL